MRVSFATSTYRKAKEFQEGLEELHRHIPLLYAREYLFSGRKRPEYGEEVYRRIDELHALRKAGICGEMTYALAQTEKYLAQHPEEGGSPEEFLGEAVINGTCPDLTLPKKFYDAAPSLKVYELFMWMGLQELQELSAGRSLPNS